MEESGKGPQEESADCVEIFIVMARFPIGAIVVTPAAADALGTAGESPWKFLARHASRDWGEVDEEDRCANNHAVRSFGRLLSAYTMATGQPVWVITEGDRSATTILLPEEY